MSSNQDNQITNTGLGLKSKVAASLGSNGSGNVNIKRGNDGGSGYRGMAAVLPSNATQSSQYGQKVNKLAQASNVQKAPNTTYIAETKVDIGSMVPSKVSHAQALDTPAPTPAVFNEFTSVLVDESPQLIMQTLFSLFTSYSDDQEIDISPAAFQANGVTYIKHEGIRFRVVCWSENGKTRVEFKRMSGDTVLFQTFWSGMLSRMTREMKVAGGDMSKSPTPESSVGGMDLDYCLEGLDDFGCPWTMEEVGMMETGEYLKDSLIELLDAMEAYPTVGIAKMVTANKSLMEAVLSATLHSDMDQVRLALVFLETIARSCGNELIQQFDALKICSLLDHPSELIRKHCVRLLATLSKSEIAWKLDAPREELVKNLLNSCQSKWENLKFVSVDFISNSMFESIFKKM